MAVRAALGPDAPDAVSAALGSAAKTLLLLPSAGAVAVVGEPPAVAASSTSVAAAGANAAAGGDLMVSLLGVVCDAPGVGGGVDDGVRDLTVDVLAKVAGGGDRGGGVAATAGTAVAAAAGAATRTAQAALLTLATGSPPPVTFREDGGRHGPVALAAAAALVLVAGGVLGSYAVKAKRSARCPVSTGWSAEEVALLDALTEFRAGAAASQLGGTPPAVAACATAGALDVRCRATGLLRSPAEAKVGAA